MVINDVSLEAPEAPSMKCRACYSAHISDGCWVVVTKECSKIELVFSDKNCQDTNVKWYQVQATQDLPVVGMFQALSIRCSPELGQ